MKKLILLLFTIAIFDSTASNIEQYNNLIEKAESEQNLPEIINIYEELLENFDETGADKHLEPRYMYEYGMYLSYAAEYDKAIDIILKVIELTEGVESQRETRARCSMQLGLIYFFQEQWDTALEHYIRAEKLAIEIDNKLGQSIAKNNIGNIYQKKKQFSKAIENYEQSLELQETVRDSATICNTIYNIGSCYEKLLDIERAEQYFKNALQIARQINDCEIEALSQTYLGVITENADMIEKSLEVVKATGHKQVLLDAYKAYANLMAKKGDYKVAHENEVLAAQLSDSIFKEQTTKQLDDFSVRYKVKEYETEVVKQKLRLIYIGIILAIVIILSLIIYRVQRKLNNHLAETNKLKDNFLRVVSHDIKNPLISQKNILELMVNNLECLKADDIRTQCDDLLRSSSSLLEMLYNLLNWSQIEAKTIRYNPININLPTIIDEVKDMYYISLTEKVISLEVECSQSTIVHGDYIMISTVIRNLVNNAIKYSHANSSIFISATDYNDKMWKITVRDLGIGIKQDVLDSLFKLNAVKTKTGTAGEVGTGLGLIIVKQMVEMNGGKVIIESEEGKGAAISFTVNKEKNGKN